MAEANNHLWLASKHCRDHSGEISWETSWRIFISLTCEYFWRRILSIGEDGLARERNGDDDDDEYNERARENILHHLSVAWAAFEEDMKSVGSRPSDWISRLQSLNYPPCWTSTHTNNDTWRRLSNNACVQLDRLIWTLRSRKIIARKVLIVKV